MQRQLALRFSKVDVLINYWDKIVGILTWKSKKYKDTKANQFLIKILKVPKKVRLAVLMKWIKKCRMLYSIAFL